jgi:DNA-binding NarL/FixJ family response regulator
LGGFISTVIPERNKIKVLVIDEQAFFRAGVYQALSRKSDLQILDSDLSEDPLRLVGSYRPDVVLLGSNLADLSGLELGRKIVHSYPNIKVVMLSADSQAWELYDNIKTAAVACLHKNAPVNELSNAIRRVYHGESQEKHRQHDKEYSTTADNQLRNLAQMLKNVPSANTPLTNREKQVLICIADGNTNKQIAGNLDISEQTVKSHISTILNKLNANDRAHAVALSMRNGWLLDVAGLAEKDVAMASR